jgi:hypothetical protein
MLYRAPPIDTAPRVCASRAVIDWADVGRNVPATGVSSIRATSSMMGASPPRVQAAVAAARPQTIWRLR